MQQNTKLSTRVQLKKYLERHLKEKSAAPISFTHLAQEFGVSRERIRQLYNQLKILYSVPSVQKRRPGRNAVQREQDQQRFASIDRTILGLRNRGMTYEQIVRYSNLPIWDVKRSIRRLIKNGVIAAQPSSQHRKELIQQVKCLRSAGMARPQIAKQLGVSISTIGSIISTLLQAGELAKRPPREELLNAVKTLKQRNLHYTQIAERLGLSTSQVLYAIQQLKRRGEALSSSYQIRTFELDREVSTLLAHGMRPKAIAERLGRPQGTIYAAISRLAKGRPYPA